MKTNSKEFLERLGTFGLANRSQSQVSFSEKLLSKEDDSVTDTLIGTYPLRHKAKAFFKSFFSRETSTEKALSKKENVIAEQRESELSADMDKVRLIQKQLSKKYKKGGL